MAYPDIVSSQRDLFERRRQLQAQELSGLEESMKLAKQQQDLVEELTKIGDASLSEVLKTRGQVNEIQSTIVNKRNAYRQERSEEHTSELQSLMRISYAVFCLKTKKNKKEQAKKQHTHNANLKNYN